MDIKSLIEQLGLTQHPEGGWYRETYRSETTLSAAALPNRYGGDRSLCTAIYFLLETGDISALHRIASDELWFFHTGVPLRIHSIAPDGTCQTILLGAEVSAGCRLQVMIPAGCWFGAELTGDGFALVSCTVAPGFDFSDFELGVRDELIRQYPQHAGLVTRLTH